MGKEAPLIPFAPGAALRIDNATGGELAPARFNRQINRCDYLGIRPAEET
jgi:hypothetical protein